MATVKWKKSVLKNIMNKQQKKMVAVGFQLEGHIKQLLSTGGGKEHEPSTPTDPPHVQTGRLRASISTNWTNSGMPNAKTDPIGGGKHKEFNIDDGMGMPDGDELDPDTGGVFKVVVGTNVEYAPILEYGFGHMSGPRPFIRPAFDELKPQIEKMLGGL